MLGPPFLGCWVDNLKQARQCVLTQHCAQSTPFLAPTSEHSLSSLRKARGEKQAVDKMSNVIPLWLNTHTQTKQEWKIKG